MEPIFFFFCVFSRLSFFLGCRKQNQSQKKKGVKTKRTILQMAQSDFSKRFFEFKNLNASDHEDQQQYLSSSSVGHIWYLADCCWNPQAITEMATMHTNALSKTQIHALALHACRAGQKTAIQTLLPYIQSDITLFEQCLEFVVTSPSESLEHTQVLLTGIAHRVPQVLMDAALEKACACGQTSVAEYLLQLGADPSVNDSKGFVLAAQNAHVEIVTLLWYHPSLDMLAGDYDAVTRVIKNALNAKANRCLANLNRYSEIFDLFLNDERVDKLRLKSLYQSINLEFNL